MNVFLLYNHPELYRKGRLEKVHKIYLRYGTLTGMNRQEEQGEVTG